MNYVFYVCDMDDLPSSGHFRKMDAGREIAAHIDRMLPDCIVKKYTEYNGEVISADSVGIIVPAHRWGISLPVYAFLNNIRVSEGTYVYVTVVGETLSECSVKTMTKRLGFISSLRKQITKKGLCTDRDIFVRCIDTYRSLEYTETVIKEKYTVDKKLECIMNGLFMYNIEELETREDIFIEKQNEKARRSTMTDLELRDSTYKGEIDNVYLNEDVLEGIRLCRVI